MTQLAKVQEPSMEEILASIRRIIADDEAKPADLAPAGGHSASASPEPAAAPRIHNVAAVASHPAPVHVAQARGETDEMLAGNNKTATSAASGPAMHAVSASQSNVMSAPASHSKSVDDDADVFDLTDEMALPSAAASFRKVEPKDDLEFDDAPPSLAERNEPRSAPHSASPSFDHADILSKTTASAVESAFNSLASTVLSANSRTLEDLVKEMMRPMLKTWLDDNLPGLVERIVKTEIERVARGR